MKWGCMVFSSQDFCEVAWDNACAIAISVSAMNEASHNLSNDYFIALYTQLKLTNSDLSDRAVNGWKVHIKKIILR